MTVLTLVLFLLGLLFIFMGFKWQNPPSTEIITTLRGMAHLKKEITKLQQSVNSLEEKVEENAADNGVHAELANAVNSGVNNANFGLSDTNYDVNNTVNHVLAGRGYHGRLHLAAGNQGIQRSDAQKKPQQRIPDDYAKYKKQYPPVKYKKVLELANQGLDVRQIAMNLGLSRDAVTMVLLTYGRGEKV